VITPDERVEISRNVPLLVTIEPGSNASTRAATFIRKFHAFSFAEVVAPSQSQFGNPLALYDQRPDKSWSLTDCISFQIMEDRGISAALTGDHHFEQAGFVALLQPPV
jgi:predicted nucleic acid-binding protein